MRVAAGTAWVVALSGSLVLMLAVGGGLLLNQPAPPSELDRLLASVGATIDLPDTVATLDVQANAGALQSLLVADGEARLRIRVTEDLTPDAARARVRDLRALIDGLFEDHQVPYPGELSHTLTCPAAYLPSDGGLPATGDALGMVHLFANDRLAFGGCSADLLRYQSTVGYYYSTPGRRLFVVEYHSPIAAVDPGHAVVQSFRITPTEAG